MITMPIIGTGRQLVMVWHPEDGGRVVCHAHDHLLAVLPAPPTGGPLLLKLTHLVLRYMGTGIETRVKPSTSKLITESS